MGVTRLYRVRGTNVVQRYNFFLRILRRKSSPSSLQTDPDFLRILRRKSSPSSLQTDPDFLPILRRKSSASSLRTDPDFLSIFTKQNGGFFRLILTHKPLQVIKNKHPHPAPHTTKEGRAKSVVRKEDWGCLFFMTFSAFLGFMGGGVGVFIFYDR